MGALKLLLVWILVHGTVWFFYIVVRLLGLMTQVFVEFSSVVLLGQYSGIGFLSLAVSTASFIFTVSIECRHCVW